MATTKTSTYKIAVLVIKAGEIHQRVVAGLRDSFFQSAGADTFEVNIFEAKGTAPDFIVRELHRIIDQGYDLIVPIGIRCTTGVQGFFREKGCRKPVVFTGVPSPVECGLISSGKSGRGDYITGVSPFQSCNSVPLQLALLLHPKLMNYVIPFRRDAWQGRILFEVERMKKYLQGFGRKVSLVSIDEGDSLGARLSDEVSSGAVIAIPLGALPVAELQVVLKAKEKFKAEVIGYADGEKPEDALLSYKSDAEYMGYRTGEYAYRILVDKVPPKDLPILELTSDRARQIEFNEKQMIARGVPPIDDDLLATLNNGITDAHYPIYYCSFLDRWNNLLTRAITRGVRAKGNQSTDEAIYGWREIIGNPYDKEAEEHWWRLGRAHCFHAVIALGEEELLGMQRGMVRDDQYRPLIHVQYGPQKLGAELKKISADWPTDMPIAQITIEGPDFLMPLKLVDMLHDYRVAAGHTKRKLLTIGLLTQTTDAVIPPLLAETVATLQEYLALRGGKLIHLHAHDLRELRKLGHELVKTCDATLMYEMFISLEAQYVFAKYAYKHRHLTCGAGSAGRELCAASYGVEPPVIGDAIFTTSREISSTGSCTQMHTHLTRAQTHTPTINEKICKYLGIPLPLVLQEAIKQGLGIEDVVDEYMSGIRKVIHVEAGTPQ